MGIGLFRLILAFTVVITHTHSFWGFTLGNPVIAVRAFFIISGFYMTMILTEKYTSTKAFITNRFLKIYPIYWSILIITILSCIGAYLTRRNWGELYYLINYLPNLKFSDQILIIISQITIFGRAVVDFNTFGKLPGMFFLLIPQAWTLVLELWFYLLIPFIYKNKLAVISLLIASILIKYTVLSTHGGDVVWEYRYFPAELCYFLLGWFSYRVYQKLNFKKFGLLALVISIFLLSIFNFIQFDIYLREWLFYIALVFLIPIIFCYSKDSVLDRSLGDLSYPVYISHILVNNVVHPLIFVPFSLDRNWQPAIVLAASIALSIVINKFVQQPIELIRRKIAS